MDFSEIVQSINQSISSGQNLQLVCSHGNARHSSFISVLIAESLKIKRRVVVLCIHQDPAFYSSCLKLMKMPFCPLSGDIQPLLDSNCLTLIDCQDYLINKYNCNPNTLINAISPNLFSELIDGDQNTDLYIDDLSSLLYLGLSSIDAAQFIRHCSNQAALSKFIVGFHLANEDDTQCKQLYAHMRGLSRLCFDLRELSTGYTSSLDGEVSISIFNEDSLMFKKSTYHYNLQSRKILCHPLGTSNMIV